MWAAMAATTICAVFAVVLALGQVVVVRHRAASAADLAALAAADRALWGPRIACRRAAEVAGSQGAEVVRCALAGEVADVTATARLGPYAPTVRARAGPPLSSSPPPTTDSAPHTDVSMDHDLRIDGLGENRGIGGLGGPASGGEFGGGFSRSGLLGRIPGAVRGLRGGPEQFAE